jgi:hypothetical protein
LLNPNRSVSSAFLTISAEVFIADVGKLRIRIQQPEVSMSLRRPFFGFTQVLAVCFLLFTATSALSQGKDWRPVSPADLQASTPLVEPNADAEAIFWEVRVDDSSTQELALRHYVRIKLFTERGRENFARHDVSFTKGTKIKDFEARVTKPDGTTAFVDKEQVLERDIVKANGFKVRAKTIAFPGLEIGSVVEYRYKEVINDGAANMRLIFQRDIPIRQIAYFVKPFAGTRALAYQPFNVGNTKFEKDKDGFFKAEMKNVPAFREEPTMLPEDEVRSWIYIYYTAENNTKNADDYWKRISEALYDAGKSSLKPNDEVRAETEKLIAGAATDDEKLRRIYDFTKSQIKNVTYAEQSTEEQKKQALKNKFAGDTLKSRVGTPGDIDQLFGAMARAAGYDARTAFSGNRNELFFNRNVPNMALMLGSTSVAVKVGNDWRFFSPAGYFTPYGMMSWIEEDQVAMIPDSKELIWKEIPLSKSDLSMEKRSGKFTLQPDGTLVGEGRIEFSGHQAYTHKMLNREDSQSVRENRLKDRIRSTISGAAEFESLSVENVNDPEKPFVYTFKIKVPGYAVRTGRRLFFQPNIFERGTQPRFTANERKYDVYFPYPYSEQDEITIDLPAGFKLESPDVPAAIKDNGGIGSHESRALLMNDGKSLKYTRSFSFGNGGYIRFPPGSYSALKGLFDAFNKADIHQLTLRAEETASTNPGK